jgi:hypothetical protein
MTWYRVPQKTPPIPHSTVAPPPSSYSRNIHPGGFNDPEISAYSELEENGRNNPLAILYNNTQLHTTLSSFLYKEETPSKGGSLRMDQRG